MQLYIDLSTMSFKKLLFSMFKMWHGNVSPSISSPLYPHWKPDPWWVLRSLHFYWLGDDFIAFMPAGESCVAEHWTEAELWVAAAAVAAAATAVCMHPAAV